MVPWFKKPAEKVLEFNREKLQTELNNMASHLYEVRGEVGLRLIQEILQTSRNIQVLEVTLAKNQDYHRGRLDAFSDLIHYIERAIASRKEEVKQGSKKPIRESISIMERRSGTQAGAAL